MDHNIWNSLEIVKIIVGVLTPISVMLFGWLINRRLKIIDHSQWTNQKLIEKRLELFGIISPLLNKLLCFYTWVGYWKDVSPYDVIQAKRELDKVINIYREILGDNFYNDYNSFIGILFETYTGPGHDARILSVISSENGDRTTDSNYTWDKTWATSFADQGKATDRSEIQNQYDKLMRNYRKSIGIINS